PAALPISAAIPTTEPAGELRRRGQTCPGHDDGGAGDFISAGRRLSPTARASEHLEIFALLPVGHFGVEAIDLGGLDEGVVVDEGGAERVAKEGVGLQRVDG